MIIEVSEPMDRGYAQKKYKMKNFTVLFAAILFLFGTQTAWADVANEGEVDVKVELINGKDFPGFEFFIRYQNYHYDMGYQPDGLTDIVLEPGLVTETNGRGDQSLLYARDEKGNEFVSKTEVGGVDSDFGPNVAYYLDQIEVISVKNGEIKFKIAARKKMSGDDKVLKIIKGDVSDGEMSTWLIILVPIFCLTGLVAFFVLRRRKSGDQR